MVTLMTKNIFTLLWNSAAMVNYLTLSEMDKPSHKKPHLLSSGIY